MAMLTSGLCYIAAVLMELFLFCWFGNEVSIKSENISRALYESVWPETSKNFKRNLFFFLTRTQKPIKIYALNFFQLSLDVFVWVN